jgi:hypothetical protein
MQSLPTNIYSVAAVRETDRTTIEDHGVPGYTLMTRAGEAAVREARQAFPDSRRWQIAMDMLWRASPRRKASLSPSCRWSILES